MKKWKQRFSNLTLYQKLMALCMVIVLPVFIGALIMSGYAINGIKKAENLKIEKELESNIADLENDFQRIYTMLVDMLNNTDQIRYFQNNYPDAMSAYELGQTVASIHDQLIRSSMTSDLITDMTVDWLGLSRRCSLARGYTTERSLRDNIFSDRAIYETFANMTQGPYGEIVIFALEYTMGLREPKYMIYADLDEILLAKKLLPVGENGIACVFGTDWSIISDGNNSYYINRNRYTQSSGAEPTGTDYERLSKISDAVRKRIAMARGSGGSFQNDGYVGVYHTSDLWGMTYCTLVPETSLSDALRIYQLLICAVGAITLLMLFLARTALQHSINRPFVKITELFDKTDLGRPVNVSDVEMQGELRDVYLRFAEMYNRLLEVQADMIRQSVALEKAEFHLQQAQIRPHFLRNCFNIVQLCLKYDDDETAQRMIEYLDKYFDYLSKSPYREALLHDEWEYVKAYLDIQKIRFGHKLKTELEALPEAIGSTLIPRLTIQSVVENVFKHSVNKSTDIRMIKASFREESDAVIICIWDNGNSVTEEQLEELRESMKVTDIPSEHVGLRNIHHRLRMLREDGGLSFACPPDGGFAVYIRVPVTQRGE